jgi:quercetin dioxygenase-like cupin family protein
MNNVFEKGTVLNFTELIDYSEGGIVSKQVLKCEAGKIILFSFEKGHGLSEHTSPYEAMVQVLDGTVEIKINGNPFILNQNETIIMPANVPHALHAVEKFKMLLTLIRP